MAARRAKPRLSRDLREERSSAGGASRNLLPGLTLDQARLGGGSFANYGDSRSWPRRRLVEKRRGESKREKGKEERKKERKNRKKKEKKEEKKKRKREKYLRVCLGFQNPILYHYRFFEMKFRFIFFLRILNYVFDF